MRTLSGGVWYGVHTVVLYPTLRTRDVRNVRSVRSSTIPNTSRNPMTTNASSSLPPRDKIVRASRPPQIWSWAVDQYVHKQSVLPVKIKNVLDCQTMLMVNNYFLIPKWNSISYFHSIKWIEQLRFTFSLFIMKELSSSRLWKRT